MDSVDNQTAEGADLTTENPVYIVIMHVALKDKAAFPVKSIDPKINKKITGKIALTKSQSGNHALMRKISY